LHVAAQQGALDVAELLFRHGATVDPVNMYGNTPLWTSVFNSKGDGRMIELLRRHGAYPYHVNVYGHTPIGAANLIANYDIAQYFADLPEFPLFPFGLGDEE
jgi:ankyrin repeat protein